jgi:phosphomannomutase
MSGIKVIDIGIVPTPTVQVMVEELGAAGGVVISASHNPVEWNAFKLINSRGTFFNSSEIKKFFSLLEKKHPYSRWDAIKKTESASDASEIHIKKVLKSVNVEKIRKSGFKITLDSVNGAGSVITPELLNRLGCTVNKIHCNPDGLFPRGAEPLPQNLKDLSAAVIKNKSDIGFAQDPDADRLAIVDEKGHPIGEELTIALVTEHILSMKKGPVVVNLSTTRAVEDIAAAHGVPFKRASVGEINVVELMRKCGAVIGGEGNGGVISPEIHLGRDSLAGIGYILEMMAVRKKKISEIVSSLPSYFMIKGKTSIKKPVDIGELERNLRAEFAGEKFTTIDGIRIDFKKHPSFKGGWVHLRSSNTEPIFRIITEASTKEKADELFSCFSAFICR